MSPESSLLPHPHSSSPIICPTAPMTWHISICGVACRRDTRMRVEGHGGSIGLDSPHTLPSLHPSYACGTCSDAACVMQLLRASSGFMPCVDHGHRPPPLLPLIPPVTAVPLYRRCMRDGAACRFGLHAMRRPRGRHLRCRRLQERRGGGDRVSGGRCAVHVVPEAAGLHAIGGAGPHVIGPSLLSGRL